MRISSDHLAKTSRGTIYKDNMNTGNVDPKVYLFNSTSSTALSQAYFHDVINVWSKYNGTQKWLERRVLWLQAEEAFEQSLVGYNNFGFLLLSITALVSSTIIAVVTKKDASRGEFSIVLVEGLVVTFFLVVLSHALVVFSRENDYVADYEVRQRTLGYYKEDSEYNIEVQGFFRRREAIVGKRYGVPIILVAAEVFAVISLLIVVWNIARLLRSRKWGGERPQVWDSPSNAFPSPELDDSGIVFREDSG